MRYRINAEKFFSDITDGIAILIEVDTGIYYGFNQLTTNIFENIVSGADTDELLKRISKIEGFTDEIKNKYQSFLDELLQRGFVVESFQELNKAELNIDKFENGEYDFVISEYKDVASLLLADPIHQVKEDKGWRPDKDSLK